jgi:hypothetical protein
VPVEYTAKGMIPAPLLSGIDSPLDSQVQQLAQQVQELAQAAGVPAGTFSQDSGSTNVGAGDGGATGTMTASSSSGGSGNSFAGTPTAGVAAGMPTSIPGCPAINGMVATASNGGTITPANPSPGGFSQNTTTTTAGGFTQDTTGAPNTPPSSAGISAGFVQDTNAASATVVSVSATVPQFVSKYRNLNLMLTGFQVATQMPSTVQCLKQSFLALKAVRSPQAAMAAVVNIQGQMTGLVQMMRVAFQKPR